MREVINVQLGTFANHVGAHFWNLQDEYLATPVEARELSPSVYFRESQQANLLYAPRVQIVDVSRAFGSLSLDSGVVLDEIPQHIENDNVWNGPAQTFRSARIPVSKYMKHLLEEEVEEQVEEDEEDDGSSARPKNPKNQVPDDEDFQLDKGVSYWSDFLKTRLHPRSCFSLPAAVTEFDKYDHGLEVSNQTFLDEVYDDLRFFIEECDSLGGIHLTVNAHDGFSGMSSQYMTRIRDELGNNSPMFVLGAIPEHSDSQLNAQEKAVKLWDSRVAEARLVSECINISAQYVPADAACVHSMKYVSPMKFNDFHSSAILALALDVAYTPLRVPSIGFSTGSLSNLLRPSSIATVSSMFTKFPILPPSGKDAEVGRFYNRPSVTKLSTRVFTKRMLPETPQRKSASHGAVLREFSCSRGRITTPGANSTTEESIPLPVPFPKFFHSHAVHRNSNTKEPVSSDCELDEVSCLAGFATSPSDGAAFLRNLGSVTSKFGSKPAGRLHTSDKSQLLEVAETLSGLSSDYAEL